jgi:L-fuculose-phosphate aldolase
MDWNEARRDVCLHAKKMHDAGLVVGSAGNVSRRIGADHIAITPTSVEYDVLSDDAVSVIDLHTGETVAALNAPSYELPMHLAVYRSRPDIAAIVHTHAPYVTTLSVLRRPLPPIIDEMMVYFGGPVEVADYALTGTDAVGTNVVRTLRDRTAVLLANHGNVCVGRTLDEALHVAMVMEACARVYIEALRIGDPVPLPNDSVVAGRRMFETRHRS